MRSDPPRSANSVPYHDGERPISFLSLISINPKDLTELMESAKEHDIFVVITTKDNESPENWNSIKKKCGGAIKCTHLICNDDQWFFLNN